jgi:NADPH:quinone reductase-like Zn-dependent oxidoreductase
MQKVVIHRAGSHDQLAIEEHGDQAPGTGEVSIAVDAIGVNYADCIVRMGLYSSARKYVGWPITPGFEVAGRVKALGTGVTDLRVGDEVLAVTRFDGYATELVVPRHQVFSRPKGLSAAQAAGFPAVFLTAHYALMELCKLRPGMKVLVHSAAGGVGGALTQIAALHGCEVVGVVGRSEKLEAARSHGAAHVIDKSRQDLWREAERHATEGYDVVLDANGVETLGQSYKHLRPTGRLVIYGFHTMMPKTGGKPNYAKLALDWLRTPRFNPLDLTEQNKSVMAFNLSYLFDRPELLTEGIVELLGWLAEGKLRPHEVRTFPLAQVAEAHRLIESGTTVGKLVLVP